MNSRLLFLLVVAITSAVSAQVSGESTLRLTVRVNAEGGPLEHATVRVDSLRAFTASAGVAQLRVLPGNRVVHVLSPGYAPDSVRVLLVAARDTAVTITMRLTAAALSGVIVMTTRSNRRIEEEPTRVEVLAGEDVSEKSEMRPADLSKFLTEMPGVQVQQTSAASGATGVRLQGLRSRYTLLLADGLPLYGGAGGAGLDLMQLPPADLRQVEVVKGPASALYGVSALGGTINLVSKRPGHEQNLLVQRSVSGGSNTLGWLSRTLDNRWGYTAVVGAHHQGRTDQDGDGWANLPGVERIEARPRLFYDGRDGTSLFVTAGGTAENRLGGTVAGATTPDGHAWVESQETRRGDVGLVAHRLLTPRTLLLLRASADIDRQNKRYGSDPERVTRTTAFAELSASHARAGHDLLLGAALQRDAADIVQAPDLDYAFGVASVFAQDQWTMGRRAALSVSARADDHSRYGVLLSPRASLLLKVTPGWTARFSATRGAYAPTPFVEETDPIGVRRVTGFTALVAEHATHVSFDLNGHTGPMEMNATVFSSRISNPVLASIDPQHSASLVLGNGVATTRTSGTELLAVYRREPFLVTALYAYVDAREPSFSGDTRRVVPRTPRQSGGIDAMWESDETGTSVALEGFYTGQQALDDDPYRTASRPFMTIALLATQRFGHCKVFLSVENLTDVRQTRFDPLWLPSQRPTGQWTTNLWAPLEGRVVSLGVRVQ